MYLQEKAIINKVTKQKQFIQIFFTLNQVHVNHHLAGCLNLSIPVTQLIYLFIYFLSNNPAYCLLHLFLIQHPAIYRASTQLNIKKDEVQSKLPYKSCTRTFLNQQARLKSKHPFRPYSSTLSPILTIYISTSFTCICFNICSRSHHILFRLLVIPPLPFPPRNHM